MIRSSISDRCKSLLRTLVAASFLMGLLSDISWAQDRPIFQIKSKAGGCLHAQGDAIKVSPCQILPGFLIENVEGSLMIKVSDSEVRCVHGNNRVQDLPTKVVSGNCSFPEGAFWHIQQFDDEGFRGILKQNPQLFELPGLITACLEEDVTTHEVSLDFCSGNPDQKWKILPIVAEDPFPN